MKPSSANVSVINLTDGRRVCLSYGVIVAAFVPRNYEADPQKLDMKPRGYLRTDARFSVTTSRHMNAFAGKDSPTIPHAELLRLCAPIESRE